MIDLIDMIIGGIAIGAIYGLVGMGFVLIIKASVPTSFWGRLRNWWTKRRSSAGYQG